MGTIGTVQALFTADTQGFDAALKGATASLGQVGEQAGIAGQKVDAATRLQEAAARRVQRVLAQVAAEQKSLASQPVSDGARKVAAATLAQSKAYAELHRVQGLVRSGNVEQTTSVDLLAAAQSRAATSSAALAEAKQREGEAAEVAGLKEALAGQEVTAEALRTTAALKEQAEAQTMLNRAQALSRTGAIAGPEGISLVAAAQLKSVEAAAEVAAAKRAEAIAVAQAAEEEALSQNVIVRAFQRVALVARESLASVKERMSLFVEDGALEMGSMSRIAGSLGSLLGAGIAITFAANFADEIAKANVELDHMRDKTGVDIQALAGLRQEFRQLGADPDSSNRALVKMDNAFAKAKSRNKEALAAFGNLGIKPEELRNIENATQLLARLSKGMAETEEQEKRTSAATAIFGKGGADMIPVLMALGGNFDAATAKLAAMTGVTDKSIEASKRWIANSAKVKAVFERLGNWAIESSGEVAGAFIGTFDGIGAAFQSLAEIMGAVITSVAKELFSFGRLIGDAMSGNVTKLPADLESVKSAFVNEWKGAFKDISSAWQEVNTHFQRTAPAPLEKPAPFGKADPEDFTPKGPKSDAARKAAEAQMQAFEHGAAVLEEQGNADAFTIHGYWSKKIEAMQKGSADYDKLAGSLNYDKVYAKLAESTKRMDELLEKSLHPKKDSAADSFLREQEHAADEQARRVAEIRQRAADAQARLQEKAQLADVSIALAHGEISRYQALVAEAQIHAASFGAEIAEVEQRLADAQAMHDLPGMDEEIAKRQAQLAQLKAQAAEQAQIDASAISSQTMGGAFHDALSEWVQQSNDAAALVRKTFTETANGINEDLAKALTDPARTQYERMQNLKAGLSSTLRGVANQGITFGLGKLESTLPGELGKLFGGGKKPTGAKGDPLYIAFDSSASGSGGGVGAALSQIAGTGSAATGLSALTSRIFGIGSAPDVRPGAPPGNPYAPPPQLLRRPQEVSGSVDQGLNLMLPSSDSTAGSGGGDIFSSIFSTFGGLLNPGAGGGGDSGGGSGSSGGGGDIFSSIFSSLGGTADTASATDNGAGTGFLDKLASFAPQQAGNASPLFGGSAVPYTAADLSMMQPNDADALSTGPPPRQRGPLVMTTQPGKPSGVGSLVQSLVGTGLKFLPGFESGGPIAPDMGSFIVGEAGPEILNIGSASAHVTPNSQLQSFGGGGDTHHHWAPGAIDARGSTNSAETEAAVQRGILRAAPMIAKMGMQGTRENRLRTASTSH